MDEIIQRDLDFSAEMNRRYIGESDINQLRLSLKLVHWQRIYEEYGEPAANRYLAILDGKEVDK